MNQFIILIVSLSPKEAMLRAETYGVDVHLIGAQRGDTLLEARMADYERIVEWYLDGSADLRRTTSYRALDLGEV